MLSSYPSVSLFNTEQHLLTTSTNNRTYQLSVSLPGSYQTQASTYAVIYVLDGNSLFPIAAETVRLLNLFNEIREVIVVGIGYPGLLGFKDIMAVRTRDLTPSSADWYEKGFRAFNPDFPLSVGEGEASAFLHTLSNDVLPFIASHYQIDPSDATLMGFSFGGLFALYALFSQPNTFKRYLICSPSIWWDNSVIFEHEKAYAEQYSDIEAEIFMSVGGEEPAFMAADVYRMVNTLRERNYTSLTLKSHFWENESHMSIVPMFISRSLRQTFSSNV